MANTHTIDNIIQHLPKELTMCLQYIKLPEDDGDALWDMLQGNEIVGASDGSHIPNTMIGSGGFILSDKNDLTHHIKGGSKCYLTHEMTSQTTEHYGIIGLITMIIVLNTKYGQPNGNTTIEVWIDNAEVLRRINIGRENMLKLADYEVADYTVVHNE